ncbi:caspase family protein [Neolewinella agarilytica]|uniref:TPR repeat n=1 Tax=Neolewinella agarilytica TaxID=478744 RepID=A0A1H9A903_9BACT|nr:caspase family protein [Neolewinella agarilytica]SEP72967.1 TPR repeat [Neolewinella agarilytica]
MKALKSFFLLNLLLFTTTALDAQINTEEANYRNWVKSENSKGIALVIGNSNYLHNGKLLEPANDAQLIANSISTKNYDVEIGLNLTKDSLEKLIIDFSEKLKRYDQVIVFYAGHGFQIDGENYLIPTDANPQKKEEVKLECVNINSFLQAINDPDKPKLIILDACRNNPFKKDWTDSQRSLLTEGMNNVSAIRNSLLIFSTTKNTTVLDNNPFTESLSAEIEQGGCISKIMSNVASLVRKLRPNQVIWQEGILEKELCFDQSGYRYNPNNTQSNERNNLPDEDKDGIPDALDNCIMEAGVPENSGCPPESSFDWWRRIENENTSPTDLHKEAIVLSKASSPDAKGKLSFMYRRAVGVSRNYEIALQLAQDAAKEGDAFAQNNLAMLYMSGKGVPVNVKNAFYWGKKSADNGDVFGQFLTGYCYEGGRGVDQSDSLAIIYYTLSANQGYTSPQINLALIFADENRGNDMKKAFYWYSMAAENGHPKAQNNLGSMYLRGDGVEQSDIKAIEYYRRAAQQGHKTAQDNLLKLGEKW